jgi:hypothetical protein
VLHPFVDMSLVLRQYNDRTSLLYAFLSLICADFKYLVSHAYEAIDLPNVLMRTRD